MADAKVGVIAAAEVNGPINNPSVKWSLNDPSTWALIFFGLAVLYLVVL